MFYIHHLTLFHKDHWRPETASLRNLSLWHMTLTDMRENRFSPVPADICLSPRVCSCMDQIVKDGSQMLGKTADETRAFPWIPLSPSATPLKFKTLFHTFGILMTHIDSSISPSLIKTQSSRGTITTNSTMFCLCKTKHSIIDLKISCNLEKTVIKQRNSYSVCHKMGSQSRNAGLPECYNEKTLPSSGNHHFDKYIWNSYINLNKQTTTE